MIYTLSNINHKKYKYLFKYGFTTYQKILLTNVIP